MKKLVLIVDDDRFVRQQVRDELAQAIPGLTFDEAEDGAVALEAIAARVPALVLLDLYMPNKSGVETLEEIRARFPAVKVVAMSSLDTPGVKELMTSSGAADFLAKPFHPLELVEMVRRHLEG